MESERLWRWVQGLLPVEGREEVETHLSVCGTCSRAVAGVARQGSMEGQRGEELSGELLHTLSGLSSTDSIKPVRTVRLGAWGRAAALLLLAAGLTVAGGMFVSKRGEESSDLPVRLVSRPHTSSMTSKTILSGETIQTGPKEGMELAFPGGTRVRLASGSEAAWDRDSSGGYRLHLRQGDLDVSVVSGLEGFKVMTSAGGVEVLGTRFSVNTVSVPRFQEGDLPAQAVLVELQDGAVRLRNGKGERTLTRRQRGILVVGRVPFPMGERPRHVPENEIKAVWNNLTDAIRTRDHTGTAFFLGVLASHGEDARRYVRSRLGSADKQEKEQIRKIAKAIGVVEEGDSDSIPAREK